MIQVLSESYSSFLTRLLSAFLSAKIHFLNNCFQFFERYHQSHCFCCRECNPNANRAPKARQKPTYRNNDD